MVEADADGFIGDDGVDYDADRHYQQDPNHLLQFGQMGSVYMHSVFGIARPRVALLSNGEEPTKGNELVLEFERPE